MESRRILVVANETVASETLHELIGREAAGTEVLVVAPALTSRVAFWSSDDGRARSLAEERLVVCLASLRSVGIDGAGFVGDANPLLAIEDALCEFTADEIVIATHPEGRSNWLARDVVARARSRFAPPIHHVVVDTLQGSELIAA
jgi:hypothetical protein